LPVSKALLEKVCCTINMNMFVFVAILLSKYAGDKEDRKSTAGYCTFVRGNLVTRRSKKQDVSKSNAEAEYSHGTYYL